MPLGALLDLARQVLRVVIGEHLRVALSALTGAEPDIDPVGGHCRDLLTLQSEETLRQKVPAFVLTGDDRLMSGVDFDAAVDLGDWDSYLPCALAC
jgi:hypothetical protein